MTTQEKGKLTRITNTEARIALLLEQKAAISATRCALTRLMEREDTTPAEILRAAELLAEIGKH